jgi:pimeloyl-ACP methyl ester carboxylesterase
MTNIANQPQPATLYLARDEGRIAYDVSGSGPLVVLVPGMGDLRSTYRMLAPTLVAAGYTVAATDLRGHGESDTSFTSYGDAATASDISALILELGGRAVVVGNSLAAGAGVIAAADHPELIDGLVLLGPFVRNPATAPGMRTLFQVLTLPLWAASVWKSYLPSLYAGAKPADFAEYRDQVVNALRLPGHAKAFSRTVRGADHAVAEARLTEVTTSVLVVMGDLDPDFPDPTAEAAWIGQTLSGKVVMVPEAGHYPQSQQPELTASVVLDFLKEVHPDA